MKRFIPFLVLQFVFLSLQAQQLPLFTQYRENTGVINPAAVPYSYMLYEHNISAGVSYRAQWTGLASAPRTQTLRGEYMSVDYEPVNILAGGALMNDQTGPTGFTGLYGRIAGIVSGDPYYGGISVGLSFGAVQYRVRVPDLILRDAGDIEATDNRQQIFPDVGAGVYAYQRILDGPFEDDIVYGGVSVPQALGLDLEFQDENGGFNTQRVQHFYGHIGFYKFLYDDSFLEPSVWVKYAPDAPVNVDVNLRYQMAFNVWVGAGYSTAGTVNLETGLAVGDGSGYGGNFRIGYGFGHSFTSFGPFVGTTHEINLAYSIGN
jgi:type IX secretion system PorP/SprF family membrane protein